MNNVKEQSDWQKRVPFEPTWCWVSNSKNPSEGGMIRLVIDYDEIYYSPYSLRDGTKYKYALPLTEEEFKIILAH